MLPELLRNSGSLDWLCKKKGLCFVRGNSADGFRHLLFSLQSIPFTCRSDQIRSHSFMFDHSVVLASPRWCPNHRKNYVFDKRCLQTTCQKCYQTQDIYARAGEDVRGVRGVKALPQEFEWPLIKCKFNNHRGFSVGICMELYWYFMDIAREVTRDIFLLPLILRPSMTHKDFRLFLTSMSQPWIAIMQREHGRRIKWKQQAIWIQWQKFQDSYLHELWTDVIFL